MSPSSSVLLETVPPPTPRSRSEISGGSRVFLRGDSGQHFLQPPDSRGGEPVGSPGERAGSGFA